MSELSTIEETWRKCREYLAAKVTPNIFALYFEPLVPVKQEGKKLILGIQNETMAAWVEKSFHDLIEEAWNKVTGYSGCKLVVESDQKYAVCVPEDKDCAEASTKMEAENSASVAKGENGNDEFTHCFNHRDTFQSFVVGGCNKFAHGACMAVAAAPGESYNPLFLYGSTGLGKTHLLQAIGQSIHERNGKAKVEYLSGEDFCNQFVTALQTNSLPAFRARYRKVDVLLLDDIQFFSGRKGIQEEFFNTFNALYNNRKQIVLTADCQVRQISDLEERLVSRFEWGLTAELQAPDYETRLAILKKKQEKQAIKFSDSVLSCIASHISSNIRKLEAALFNLVSRCSLCDDISLNSDNLTVERVNELLSDMFIDEDVKSVNVDQIQKAVADFYDIRLADLNGKARPANIAFPRQIAMYLARRLTSLSFPAIAEHFHRNHSTILHAVSAVTKKMDESQEFKHEMALLERQLKG